jgi:hypothetical protein
MYLVSVAQQQQQQQQHIFQVVLKMNLSRLNNRFLEAGSVVE